MKAFLRFKSRRGFPATVHVDQEGNILIRGTDRQLPTRRLLPDEGCHNLVADLLKISIGPRPVLVTYREACKLYALAWLLADLVPSDPLWARTTVRFGKRSTRAAHFWEYATIDFDRPETAALFRALVFSEQRRATHPNRVVIDNPDVDIIRKATGWSARDYYLDVLYRRQVLRHYIIRTRSASPGLPRSRRTATVRSVEWGGVICPKPATLLLMPVDPFSRPVPGCSTVVTNIVDLRVPNRGSGELRCSARALECLAERIQAADPSASAHSLIAMQGPLLNKAEEMRAAARVRRR